MSQTFRVERELMASGQKVPTYRVVERIGKSWWRTVTAGLDKLEADTRVKALNESRPADAFPIARSPYARFGRSFVRRTR